MSLGAKIVGTEQLHNHTAYVIEVTLNNMETWRIFRRYSLFLRLDGDLRIEYPEYFMRQPTVIPNRWAVWKYTTSERLEILQKYLSNLVAMDIAKERTVSNFLRLPDIPLFIDEEYYPSTPDVLPLDGSGEEIVEYIGKSLGTSVEGLEKISWTESLFRLLLETVLIPAMGTGSTRRGAAAVLMAARLASVSHNLDAGLFLHVARTVDWAPAKLEAHVNRPLVNGNRGAVFELIKRIGLPPHAMVDCDGALRALLTTPTVAPCPLWGNDPVEVSTALFGPQSPLARSVLNQQHHSPAREGQIFEAREYVEFSVAAGRAHFLIPHSEPAEPMRIVPVPEETLRVLQRTNGAVTLSFRPVSFEDIEVRIECMFNNPDMQKLVQTVWNSQEEFVEQIKCHFSDPRRPKGIAVLNLLKSVSRGVNGQTVVLAASATTSNDTVLPNEKQIHHLHYVGGEIDLENYSATFVGLVSSEAIFLIAPDLLGERLLLWKWIETIFQ